MAVICSTGFETDLTGGIGFSSLNTPANITQDASVVRHGTYSMKVVGSTLVSVFGKATTATRHMTGRFYFQAPALPGVGEGLRILQCICGTSNFHITLNPNGKLQHSIAAVDGTSSTTVLSTATMYMVDFLLDSSTSTFTIDYRLSDTNGTLLFTATQLAVAGQTPADITSLQLGQSSNFAVTVYIDDVEATDQAADYPLGPGVGNDGLFPPITTFPASWVDDDTLISGGMLFGMMTQNFGVGDNGQAALAESAAKANRRIDLFGTYYSNITTVPPLTFERQIQLGILLGHQGWTMVHPFGFSGPNTSNWPAAGLVSFSDGTLDATFDSWVTVLNAQLGATPFLIRVFREFNNNAVMWGRNGAANGGVNETPTTFINAWRYFYTYIRSRVPMARFVWCADVTTAPSDSFLFYPGDTYIDWIGVDSYGTSGNGYSPATGLTTFYNAYNPLNGSLGLTKPIMVCESAIQKADPNRIADTQAYNALMSGMPAFKVFNHWDSASTGPYYVSDSPAGFLAAFQQVVRTPPFAGFPYQTLGLSSRGRELYVEAA